MAQECSPGGDGGFSLRVLAYNIRHGQGVGGAVSNRRIARVVEASGCDLAGLNEVWRIGTRFDQPSALGQLTGRSAIFHSLQRTWRREIGNLLLASIEVGAIREIDLGGRREPRGCLLAEARVGGEPIAFAVTHLSLHARTRSEQVVRLTEALPSDRPLVLVGDFNCPAGQLGVLRERLTFPSEVPPTYPSLRPFRALDHIAFSEHWALESLETMPSLASDHRPLVARLRLMK